MNAKREVKSVLVTVRLTEQMAAAIDELVSESGEDRAFVVRQALREFVAQHGGQGANRPKPRAA